ncbi:MAG: helicase-exonuclease AddAB subunit AddA [Lachnospiraceae bacterium]|nr:helicase-exonuclease AddAB subunit AddA [Lachnospiraceae bacterium]
MAMNFTEDQQRVIDIRNSNVLVAAAAGSGKTAVLVERIIQLITDKEKPVDIDRLLVVTFTNAAAAQMRERIYQAIIRKLEEEPEDPNLARQAALVHNAMIMTIHSFCLFLLHNHFHEIGLDPAFRIADEGETSLMREDVKKALFEECYTQRSEAFLHCKDYFAPGVRDTALAQLVEKLADFALSYPEPKKWLERCKRDYKIGEDYSPDQTDWMQLGMLYAYRYLLEDRRLAGKMMQLCEEKDGPYMYAENVKKDAALLDDLFAAKDYETLRKKLADCKFSTLSRKKDESVSEEKKTGFKILREMIKEDVKTLKNSLFFESAGRVTEGLAQSKAAVETLIDLTISYLERFEAYKRDRGVIDFSDMEHLALKILLDEETKEPGQTAASYRDYFEQIMIDEYQDSNLVQELMLSAISREDSNQPNNRFMVGDIKQSIYRFRLARPEIFLEKYKAYEKKDEKADPSNACERIDLSKNFRSRREVIESVNQVFEKIMTEAVGGVEYDEKAALYAGAVYPEISGNRGGFQTELLIYEEADPEMSEKGATERTAENEEILRNRRQKEAVMVASKIEELVGSFQITDEETGKPRPAGYRDIVILLRSNQGWDEVFKKALNDRGIPVYTESKTGYFAADEVQNVLNFLRVLKNPYHDIPLTAVMTSVFGGMTADDLAALRLRDPDKCLYENLLTAKEEKAVRLREQIEKYRTLSDHTDIYRLLCIMMKDYHYPEYVEAMPDGRGRRANVEMLLQRAVDFEKTSYHGLYSFIHYMEKLQKYEVDFGEADQMAEDADVVRIMSIHKSKGLEFPICFMAGMAKKINLLDLRGILFMDVDYGLAVPVIDCNNRVKRKSLRKEILAQKMKLDTLGEELRILYVGMTRAREKLFLCGAVADYEKLVTKWEAVSMGGGTVPFSRLSSMQSHLEYVVSAVGRNGFATTVFHDGDLLGAQVAKELSGLTGRKRLEAFISGCGQHSGEDGEKDRLCLQFEEKFSYQYPYDYLSTLYTKTSVSELKKAHIHEDEETQVVFETDETARPYLPGFCRQKEEAGGTARGTAYHRLLELIDYKALYRLYEEHREGNYAPLPADTVADFTKQEFERIGTCGKMKEDIGLVSQKHIQKFLESKSAYRMARADRAGKLYKEQPFVMAVDANRIRQEVSAGLEEVLIQGIIDVFFVETDETGEAQVVVLDYKTDRIESGQALVRRYQTQLDYYGEALRKLTTFPNKEKIIYSFHLGEELSF